MTARRKIVDVDFQVDTKRAYLLWRRRVRTAARARAARDKAADACVHAAQRASDALVLWLLSGVLRKVRWTAKADFLLALPSQAGDDIARALAENGSTQRVPLLEDREAWFVSADLRLAELGPDLELHATAHDDRNANADTSEPPGIREVAKRLGLDVDWKGAEPCTTKA